MLVLVCYLGGNTPCVVDVIIIVCYLGGNAPNVHGRVLACYLKGNTPHLVDVSVHILPEEQRLKRNVSNVKLFF